MCVCVSWLVRSRSLQRKWDQLFYFSFIIKILVLIHSKMLPLFNLLVTWWFCVRRRILFLFCLTQIQIFTFQMMKPIFNLLNFTIVNYCGSRKSFCLLRRTKEDFFSTLKKKWSIVYKRGEVEVEFKWEWIHFHSHCCFRSLFIQNESWRDVQKIEKKLSFDLHSFMWSQ